MDRALISRRWPALATQLPNAGVDNRLRFAEGDSHLKRDTYGKTELGDFLERKVYPSLNRAAVFKKLEPVDKGFYYLVHCPKCAYREAYVYKTGHVLKCNRINKCGHTVSLVGFANGGKTPKDADEYVEAVRKLATLAGIGMPKRELRPEEKERARKREARQAILESVIAYGQRILWSQPGEEARAYLRSDRGFTDEEIQALGLGLIQSVQELKEGLEADGHQAKDIEETGIFTTKVQSYVIIPWSDEHGRPMTIYGRWPFKESAEGTPRSVTLPGGDELRAFPLCFNLALRNGHKDIVLVQGVFEAFLLQARGDTRVVACGADHLSPPQVETLARHKCRSVTLVFDPERGGDRSVMASIDSLNAVGIGTYVASKLPDGVTPDELVLKHGVDTWRDHLTKSVSGPVFRGLQLLGAVRPKSGDAARREAVEKVLDYTATLRGEWVALDREDLLRATAERTGYAFEHLSELSADHAVRRRVDQILREGQAAMTDGKTDPLRLARKLAGELAAVHVRTDEPASFSVERLDRESGKRPVGRNAGWKSIEALDVRFNPSELSLVAARTGHGKTAFLVGLFVNWLKAAERDMKDVMFVFYTSEEPEVRIYHRLMAILSVESGDGWTVGEAGDYLRDPASRGPDYRWPDPKTLAAARDRLRSWEDRIHLVYRPNWTIDEVAAHARDLKDKNTVAGIVVDYLQRVHPPIDSNHQGPNAAFVARRLKQLAGELAIPIVAGVEITEESVSKDLKSKIGRVERYKDALNLIRTARPNLNSLRENGCEQEADAVIGLLNYAADYRAEAEKAAEIPDTTLLEVGTLKNPYGAVGSWASLYFVGRFGIIRDPSYPGET